MRTLLFAIAICWATQIHAQPPSTCDCLWQGAFTQVAEQADLLLSGEVIRSKGNSIDLRVDNIFKDRQVNGAEFQPEIRIWLANGQECRPEVSAFPLNSQWLMALKKITTDVAGGFNPNTPNISYGRINDYYLSACGAYWLNLQEGFVSGNLVGKQRWQWEIPAMNPVLLELIAAYIDGRASEQALVEAAKPQSSIKQLMQATKDFLQSSE